MRFLSFGLGFLFTHSAVREKGHSVPDTKSFKMTLELTYQDVAEHNTKKDLYVVIHDKIYDITKFVDEHP